MNQASRPAVLASLNIADLHAAYRQGTFTLKQFFSELLSWMESQPEVMNQRIFITRLSRDQVMSYVHALQAQSIDDMPLYGVPFVIKDNIDLAGVPTTAACPAYAYIPRISATVVQQLIAAGAIPLGKTNLDQFATGLVGTRSPYGIAPNSFNADYIPGGSSSGSAVAVALGMASFSLGTDTAGSGRIPAAFNNLVGVKSSVGRLSAQGVVPACRTLDCISIFALNAHDAARVLKVAEGADVDDEWLRPTHTALKSGAILANTWRVGVPLATQLQFFGNAEYAAQFAQATERLRSLGATLVELDISPLLEAARLLYDGPWVAERYAAIQSFIEATPDALHPVTRQIIETARDKSAVQGFQAQYQLQLFKQRCTELFTQVDAIMTPTAGTHYRVDEVLADPIRTNANLGYYTNFMNLLDLAAVAVPTGFCATGLPFGVTLFSVRDTDHALLQRADQLQRACTAYSGAYMQPLPSQPPATTPALLPEFMLIAVCGAHMQGLPLNSQLSSRGAYFIERTHTAAQYRLYALPGGPTHRPGLTRVAAQGASIEVELWALHQSQWGAFTAGIPSPLSLGTIHLADGRCVMGFLCEAVATADAEDISSLGGWRAYLSR